MSQISSCNHGEYSTVEVKHDSTTNDWLEYKVDGQKISALLSQLIAKESCCQLSLALKIEH